MAQHQLSKLRMGVRFPLPALIPLNVSITGRLALSELVLSEIEGVEG